jgi:hypothetical protein
MFSSVPPRGFSTTIFNRPKGSKTQRFAEEHIPLCLIVCDYVGLELDIGNGCQYNRFVIAPI